MAKLSGTAKTGEIYSIAVSSLPGGTDYTYFFEAYDAMGSIATGPPTVSVDAPDVKGLPVISIDDNILNFGEIPRKQYRNVTFNITNTGGGNLSGNISTDSKSWITVSPTSFSGNSTKVTVTVYCDDGVKDKKDYTGIITITSNGGTAKITVKISATCVVFYPNPYSIMSGKKITFWGSGVVPFNTTVRIYTLGGDLVKTLTETTGNKELYWDGTNETGAKIVPGIYLYTSESPKEKDKGRITVIR